MAHRKKGVIVAFYAFAAVLVLIGSLVFYNSFWSALRTPLAARDWLPVEGAVAEASLDKTRHVSSGPKSSGSVYYIYDVKATYEYKVDGRTYTNDRVGSRGADNSDYHEGMYALLEAHQRERTPVTVWYDPGNPAESILDRSIPWDKVGLSLLASVAFFVVGLGIAFIVYKYTASHPAA